MVTRSLYSRGIRVLGVVGLESGVGFCCLEDRGIERGEDRVWGGSFCFWVFELGLCVDEGRKLNLS